MSSAEILDREAKAAGDLRDEWLGRLTALVNDVEAWVKELGWTTERIEKTMRDPAIGTYLATGLLIQKSIEPGLLDLLLEPVAGFSPRTGGVVDLYRMPTYADIASLYYYLGGWKLHALSRDQNAVATFERTDSTPLSKEALHGVLEGMIGHAV